MQMERTRLFVDGVRAPLKADVTRRRDDGLVVSQPLPFLRLDTPVTEHGRRARISRVAIAMDGDVPRLLLELSHDAEQPAEPAPTGDDTLVGFTPGVSTRPARTDGTVPYECSSRSRRLAARSCSPIRRRPSRRLARAWRAASGRPSSASRCS